LALGEKAGYKEFYLSGDLATYDTVTGILTLVSFVFGLCLCVPFVAAKFRGKSIARKTLLSLVLTVVIAFHLVLVFALRLLTYLRIGGTWP
jgi:hypothetical protein